MPTLAIVAVCLAAAPIKGEVVTYANLTVYPIYSAPTVNPSDYISLDEGLKTGVVTITETGSRPAPPLIRNRGPLQASINRQVAAQQVGRAPGGTVNTLWLTNRSGKKLLILTGEIVSGGKQDRIIQKDVLVPSSKEAVNLSVFCVEQQRWSGTNMNFATGAAPGGAGGALADPSLRGKSQHERSQSAVWGQVDVSLSKLKTGNSTKTYQANLRDSNVQKTVDSYVKGIEKSFPADRALGVAVAINGRMVWMDRFSANPMFRKYWPKMIRSYALEAMQSSERTPSPKPPTYDSAMRYAEARDGKMTHEAEDGVWQLTKIETPTSVIYELHDLALKASPVLHASKMTK